MNIFQAIIQGIIQGATEFLPISSSGHLSLAQHFMDIRQTSLLFSVMLHLGTLLAVLAVYYKLVWRLIKSFCGIVKDVFTGKFKWSKMDGDRNLVMMLIIGLLPLVLLFVPLPGIGSLKDFASGLAVDSDIIVEGCALLLTSLLLTLGMRAAKKASLRRIAQGSKNAPRNSAVKTVGRHSYNVLDALCVGLTQCVAAVFPGLSRSGSTLSVGLLRGIDRKTALDYSFVIGIPSILAAAALELKDAVATPGDEPVIPILAGIVTAAIVGFFAIKLLRWMVASNRLGIFVVYTLIVGIAVVAIGIIEHSSGVNFFTNAVLKF